MPETSPGQDRDMVETSTRQHRDITGTRPGFHRDMPGWIFSRCMRRGRPPYPWKTPNLSFLRNKKLQFYLTVLRVLAYLAVALSRKRKPKKTTSNSLQCVSCHLSLRIVQGFKQQLLCSTLLDCAWCGSRTMRHNSESTKHTSQWDTFGWSSAHPCMLSDVLTFPSELCNGHAVACCLQSNKDLRTATCVKELGTNHRHCSGDVGENCNTRTLKSNKTRWSLQSQQLYET